MSQRNSKAAQNQAKTIRTEEKMNLFRDTKRRLIYPMKDLENAYVINPGKDGFVYMYDGRFTLALFPLAALYGLLRFNFYISFAISVIVYCGITWYFNAKYIKQFRTIKMKPEDVEKAESLSVMKSRRNDRFFMFIAGLFIAIIIFANFFVEQSAGELALYHYVLTGLCALIILVMALQKFREAWGYQKKVKEKKQG